MPTPSYEESRRNMVENQLRARGIRDLRVLDVMLRVPRHEFVLEQFKDEAYEDHPLPIGADQTISQPFIIALSLQALELTGSESVLEVGTGSGYQTALLARLGRQVYSVDRHSVLARTAESALARMGFVNTQVGIRDGSQGWPEHSPYNAILVSAAAPDVPKSLVAQLAEGGRMVIPVGPVEAQKLQLIRKNGSTLTTKTIESCRFVPLVGIEGY